MTGLTQRIKQQALDLGFDTVGVCGAEPPHNLALLADWLDAGCHGTMQWMERTRDKRLDLRRVLPGVRSVIVTGMNYDTAGDTRCGSLPGRISRYAQGVDYHEVLGERLHSLAGFVRRLHPEAATRVYVDTGPVAEKVWAQQAGLGWEGKHSNLLTQDFSSWLFLGVLLTDLELDPDRPAADHCGTCTRCIDACPTEAITQPYVVDSRRCISYLNIELRGPMPQEWRAAVGDWIYGCDICQDVCPWNRFRQPTREAAFAPSERARLGDPLEWLDLSLEDFRARFRHSAMSRARRAGLLRNLMVVLGNSGDRRYAPALMRALAHEEPLCRGHAAWALARLGCVEASGELRRRRTVESDPWVRNELDAALAVLAGKPAPPDS